MVSDRSHFAITGFGDSIYLIGGQSQKGSINAAEVFVSTTKTCASIAPLRYAREGAAATAVKGNIFVFGGTNQDGVVGAVELFDPAKNRWYAVSTMKSPRTIWLPLPLMESYM
jgi:hypothetical protein